MIRVRGPRAVEIVDHEFVPSFGKPFRASSLNRPRVGKFGREIADEVVVILVETTPATIEIHGHGGTAAVEAILQVLDQHGVGRSLAPEKALDEAWSRAAWEMLPHAPSLRVAEILLEQASGVLDLAWENLVRQERADLDSIEEMLRNAKVGTRLIDGWVVGLAGRPNVGKSRLLNALAGYGRAVVSATAGTTRDVVGVRTAFEGWPVELLDLAGIRETADPLEHLGIARAREALENADLALVVLDRSEPLSAEDHAVLRAYPNALIVANKSDQPSAWNPEDFSAVAVSAATGEGISDLGKAIAARLVPVSPAPGAAVPVHPEMTRRLEAMRDHLKGR